MLEQRGRIFLSFKIKVAHSDTDNAQVSFVLLEVCQPVGATINFSKIARNQNQTILFLQKPLSLPLSPASKICLGCTTSFYFKMW